MISAAMSTTSSAPGLPRMPIGMGRMKASPVRGMEPDLLARVPPVRCAVIRMWSRRSRSSANCTLLVRRSGRRQTAAPRRRRKPSPGGRGAGSRDAADRRPTRRSQRRHNACFSPQCGHGQHEMVHPSRRAACPKGIPPHRSPARSSALPVGVKWMSPCIRDTCASGRWRGSAACERHPQGGTPHGSAAPGGRRCGLRRCRARSSFAGPHDLAGEAHRAA